MNKLPEMYVMMERRTDAETGEIKVTPVAVYLTRKRAEEDLAISLAGPCGGPLRECWIAGTLCYEQ